VHSPKSHPLNDSTHPWIDLGEYGWNSSIRLRQQRVDPPYPIGMSLDTIPNWGCGATTGCWCPFPFIPTSPRSRIPPPLPKTYAACYSEWGCGSREAFTSPTTHRHINWEPCPCVGDAVTVSGMLIGDSMAQPHPLPPNTSLEPIHQTKTDIGRSPVSFDVQVG